ncbi:hypothetical protein BGX24_002416 [Mortierella sp. AD032]|nr:hypothetical protein BGX24_002416 [Mortierella sp. AD032]
MRSAILLLAAAAFTAVQAAPVSNSVESEAASINYPPVRCGIVNNVWTCWGGPNPNSEPQASAEPLGRCWRVDDEWVCPPGDGPDPNSEPQASAEPLGRCWRVDDEWVCPPGDGPDPNSGGSSPSRLPCRYINGKVICPDLKK